jgi:phosphoglycolate phosphatase
MGRDAVFDLDGTLIDSAPLFSTILNAMLAERGSGRAVTTREVAPHVTAGGLAMIQAVLGLSPEDGPSALAEFRARLAVTPTPASSLYPGARAALRALQSAGWRLSLFSNKPQSLCEKALSDLAIGDHFSAVVGTGPGVPMKPDPSGLDLALGRRNGARDGCCYVGDSDVDVRLARTAAVPLVLVSWGYGTGATDGAAAVASDFASIPACIERAVGWSAQP